MYALSQLIAVSLMLRPHLVCPGYDCDKCCVAPHIFLLSHMLIGASDRNLLLRVIGGGPLACTVTIFACLYSNFASVGCATGYSPAGSTAVLLSESTLRHVYGGKRCLLL